MTSAICARCYRERGGGRVQANGLYVCGACDDGDKRVRLVGSKRV